MSSGGFTEVFGGQALYPSQPTYINLSISANTVLAWPIEQQVSGSNIVAAIIDVTGTFPGLTVTLPSAQVAGTGNAVLFNNIGVQTVTILDASGTSLLSLLPNTQWFIYLADNTTVAGSWRVYQLGATTSIANASALAGAGLLAVGNTLNQSMPVTAQSSNYAVQNSDRANTLLWSGGVGIFTLPDATVVGNNWFTVVKNLGSGNVVLTPTVLAQTVDSAATEAVAPGQGCFVGCDGTQYFTVGLGSAGTGAFDFTTLNVSGAGNYVLAGAALNRIAYRLNGTLTGNRLIVVPGTIQEYWIDNETSGSFALTVGTSGQVSPISIVQGQRAILYCDGTNVISATSSQSVYPITIAQGGTGALTASGALANLGAVPAIRNINTGSGLLGGASLATDLTLTIDGTIVPLLATSVNVFTGLELSVTNANPRVSLVNPGAATDAQRWDFLVSGTSLLGRIVNNAQTTALAWLSVQRNVTTSVTSITLGGPTYIPGGSLAAPSFGFSADPTTGLYSVSPATLSFALGGLEALTLISFPTTGTATPTFNNNKPGSSNGTQEWLPVKYAGTNYYIPLFGA